MPRSSLADAAGGEGNAVMVVVQVSGYTVIGGFGRDATRNIGIVGAGQPGEADYGEVGKEVQIDIDNQGNYRPIGGPYLTTCRIVAYVAPTMDAAREYGIRSFYHFD